MAFVKAALVRGRGVYSAAEYARHSKAASKLSQPARFDFAATLKANTKIAVDRHLASDRTPFTGQVERFQLVNADGSLGDNVLHRGTLKGTGELRIEKADRLQTLAVGESDPLWMLADGKMNRPLLEKYTTALTQELGARGSRLLGLTQTEDFRPLIAYVPQDSTIRAKASGYVVRQAPVEKTKASGFLPGIKSRLEAGRVNGAMDAALVASRNALRQWSEMVRVPGLQDVGNGLFVERSLVDNIPLYQLVNGTQTLAQTLTKLQELGPDAITAHPQFGQLHEQVVETGRLMGLFELRSGTVSGAGDLLKPFQNFANNQRTVLNAFPAQVIFQET